MGHHSSTGHIVILAVFCFLGLVALFLFCYILFLIVDEKNKVDNIPKIPMLMCDKHALFPESHAIESEIPVEGGKPVIQKLCPTCVAERFEAVEKSFK